LTKGWIVGAGAIILNHLEKDGQEPTEKKILLLKRNKPDDAFKGYWTCPAGRPNNPSEKPHQTAMREVEEETGLKIEITKEGMLGSWISDKNGQVYISIVHLGEWKGKVQIDNKELSDWGCFTHQEATKLSLAFAYREVIEYLHQQALL
jgi:ADP-ribose pyrophosphatase YjhB (NUDIX family)